MVEPKTNQLNVENLKVWTLGFRFGWFSGVATKLVVQLPQKQLWRFVWDTCLSLNTTVTTPPYLTATAVLETIADVTEEVTNEV